MEARSASGSKLDLISFATALTSARAFGANARKFGASSMRWNRSRSCSTLMVSTFNSSARIPWNSVRAGPATIQPCAQGRRCLRPASTRMRRPTSANSRTKAIEASKSRSCGGSTAVAAAASLSHSSEVAPSRLPGVPRGHAAWCTVSPARFRWMTSTMNGLTGAINLHTVVKTSWRVCWHASLSADSASSHSLRRLRRTYQFDRSLTTKSSKSRHALW